MNKILKIRNGNIGIKDFKISQYIISILIIVGISVICSPLANTENYHLVSYILLFVVSTISTFLCTGAVLLGASLGALIWNYFFIPPHFTFNIDKTEDILIFSLFFFIAIVTGVLTTRILRQQKIALERENRTNALLQLTKKLSGASGINNIVKVSRNEIIQYFSLDPVFLLQDGENALITHDYLTNKSIFSKIESDIAEWVFLNLEEAGANTNKYNDIEYTFFPLTGMLVNPGIICIKSKESFIGEQKSFWETFIAQISSALEREFLGETAQKVRLLDESDRLYKTLFNSISHEFRIPVATIMGASDTLLNSNSGEEVQSALNREIFTASLRLNRLVENLLNISRIESGHITLRLDWYDINDLFNKLSEDLSEELKAFEFETNISDKMPLVRFDFGLMEQTLYNIIHNSTQYAKVNSVIKLNAHHSNDKLIIEIADQGEGFPESELKSVFKKFHRLNENKAGGLGLGLSIAKGFVDAHQGNIEVENIKSGGVKFTIVIPSKKPDMNKPNKI